MGFPISFFFFKKRCISHRNHRHFQLNLVLSNNISNLLFWYELGCDCVICVSVCVCCRVHEYMCFSQMQKVVHMSICFDRTLWVFASNFWQMSALFQQWVLRCFLFSGVEFRCQRLFFEVNGRYPHPFSISTQ